MGQGILGRTHWQSPVHRRRRYCRRPIQCRRHQRRSIRVNEAHRPQDVSAFLRNLPLRQARADRIRRLLLRPIHALDSTRSHPTARPGSIKRGNASLTNRRARAPFSLKRRGKLRALGASSPLPGHPPVTLRSGLWRGPLILGRSVIPWEITHW